MRQKKTCENVTRGKDRCELKGFFFSKKKKKKEIVSAVKQNADVSDRGAETTIRPVLEDSSWRGSAKML